MDAHFNLRIQYENISHQVFPFFPSTTQQPFHGLGPFGLCGRDEAVRNTFRTSYTERAYRRRNDKTTLNNVWIGIYNEKQKKNVFRALLSERASERDEMCSKNETKIEKKPHKAL
jgi:hypothetical protein